MDSPDITAPLLGLYENYGYLTVRNMKVFLKWAGMPKLDKESRILDCGCANGLLLKELETKGFTNLIGVDASEEMVSRARKSIQATIHLATVENLESIVPSASMDIIVVSNILHHLDGKEAWDLMLQSCHKVLKPSGWLIVREPYNTLLNRFLRWLSKYSFSRFSFLKPIVEDLQAEWDLHNYFFAHWYPEESERMKRCGFKIETKRDWLFQRFYKCSKIV